MIFDKTLLSSSLTSPVFTIKYPMKIIRKSCTICCMRSMLMFIKLSPTFLVKLTWLAEVWFLERVWKSANGRGYYRTSIRRLQGLQTTSVRKCRWADRGAWQWNCQRLKPIYARRRASARKGLTNEKGFWENQNSFSFRMILVYYENDSFGFAIIKIDKSMIVKGKKILYNVTNCYK